MNLCWWLQHSPVEPVTSQNLSNHSDYAQFAFCKVKHYQPLLQVFISSLIGIITWATDCISDEFCVAHPGMVVHGKRTC